MCDKFFFVDFTKGKHVMITLPQHSGTMYDCLILKNGYADDKQEPCFVVKTGYSQLLDYDSTGAFIGGQIDGKSRSVTFVNAVVTRNEISNLIELKNDDINSLNLPQGDSSSEFKGTRLRTMYATSLMTNGYKVNHTRCHEG